MKMKIMIVIGTVLLLSGIMIVSSSNRQYSMSTPTSQNPINQSKLNQNTKIIAYGNCYGISVDGDIKQGEGRDKLMVGRITANLSIRNEPPIPPGLLGELVPYVLTIIYPDTGEIYIKTLLPLYCYLSNFTGFGYINDYYESWGRTRGIFFLYGFIDNAAVKTSGSNNDSLKQENHQNASYYSDGKGEWKTNYFCRINAHGYGTCTPEFGIVFVRNAELWLSSGYCRISGLYGTDVLKENESIDVYVDFLFGHTFFRWQSFMSTANVKGFALKCTYKIQ